MPMSVARLVSPVSMATRVGNRWSGRSWPSSSTTVASDGRSPTMAARGWPKRASAAGLHDTTDPSGFMTSTADSSEARMER